MNHDRDRDASLERLLQRTRQSSPNGDAGESCLDAETLAAWSDGSLRGAGRTAAEAHAAGCPRCQAMLAAMVRMDADTGRPRPGSRAGAWWSTLRWAVPLAGAAAAVAIWVLTQPAERFASQERAAEAPPTAPRAADSRPADQQARKDVPPPARSVEKDDRERPLARRRGETSGAPAAAAQSAVKPAAPAEAARAPSAGPPLAQPPVALAETVMVDTLRAASEAISPDPSIRWRVGAGGLVQRSIDGGATWQTQTTGVAADLVAASAPAPSTCWAVGRGGTVLLTTDGATWRRLAFPETADLVVVTATNASTADVTASDGRVYRTIDGGASWAIR